MPTPKDKTPKGMPPVNSAETGQADSESPEYTAAISAPPAEGEDGKPDLEARSVRDVAQAMGICTTAETNNRSRAWRCKAVQDLHDMAPPRAFGDKLQKGQSWQANLSTGSLSGLNQRIVQRLVQAITTAQTLTHSTLPETYAEWKAKSDLLQAGMTELFRDWMGFVPLVNMVANENSLQGYTLPLWLSPADWRPVFFKQERVLVPEGARMDVKEIQWICAKIDYPVNEFVQLFKDEAAAEKNGYDIEACERAATHAVVAQEGDDYLTAEPRRFSELLNQGTWGIAYGNGGIRCVKCWILAHVEYDGQVSFWLLGRDAPQEKALLRYVFKAFPSMQDFSGLAAFEPGNGTIHSSKGIGRKLFNLCSVLEQARCNMVDSAFLQNLIILKGDAPARNRANMTVNAPFMILPSAVELQQQKFAVTPADLATLDNLINGWMQQGVGSYISDIVNPGEDDPNKTATAKKIDFAREQESAAAAISRWEDQMYGSVHWNMQKRALSDANLACAKRLFVKLIEDDTGRADRPSLYENHEGCDSAAVQKIVGILKKWPDSGEGMSTDEFLDAVIDEIKVWRDTPATIRANILKFTQATAVENVIAKYAATPLGANLDLEAMQQADLENTLGPTLAKKYFIPKGNVTRETEAARAQLEEISSMLTLTIMLMVSERDPHLPHAQACAKWLAEVAAPQLSSPQADGRLIKCAGDILNHMGAHLEFLEKTPEGRTPEVKELGKFYEGLSGQLEKVIEIHAQVEAAQQIAARQIMLAEQGGNPNMGQQGATEQVQLAPDTPPAISTQATEIPAAANATPQGQL